MVKMMCSKWQGMVSQTKLHSLQNLQEYATINLWTEDK